MDMFVIGTATTKQLPNGARKSKSFQVKKYGLLESFCYAKKYRENIISELNSLGAGHTERHINGF